MEDTNLHPAIAGFELPQYSRNANREYRLAGQTAFGLGSGSRARPAHYCFLESAYPTTRLVPIIYRLAQLLYRKKVR